MPTNCLRHVPEQSGAVLDTRTGLRDWFDSYDEAIRIAAARNAAVQTAGILALASHAREKREVETDAEWLSTHGGGGYVATDWS